MAKIDVAGIDGYENMSADEKVAALESYDFGDERQMVSDGDIEKLRDALSRANSEAAKYKRELRAKQTEEEARAQQEAEERANMETRLADYERREKVATYKSKFLALGYGEEAAGELAEALHSGNMDAVFEGQKNFIADQRRAAVSESLNLQPGLSEGKPVTAKNIADPWAAAMRKAAGLN